MDTTATLGVDLAAAVDSAVGARPRSRAERLAHPLALQAIRELAEEHGICVRPRAMRRTDLATGRTDVIDLRCGCTRESRCRACARRALRLRQQQCRDGWHRDDEPLPPPAADEDQVALLTLRADFEYARADCLARADWAQVADLDDGIGEVEREIAASGIRGRITPSTNDSDSDSSAAGAGGDGGRRARSTRRRQDAPDLPRRKVSGRTIGKTFTGNGGAVFRPSMFLTLTLPSYGRVRDDGSPVDAKAYDYRRAAWDAVHLPALLDRLWQNLRRVEGWNVQYFGAVEPQRRLAPHAHFGVRGAIPRAVLRQVVAATYHQVWWPSTQVVRYPGHAPAPVWNPDADIIDPASGRVIGKGGYVDPSSGVMLPTWRQALDELDTVVDEDPQREPEHVVQFGQQLDMQGVLGGTPHAEKMIHYLTKYLTKSVAECHTPETATAVAHQQRLWEELRYTPCSSRCANWLRYGVQPEHARDKQRPGHCRGRVHQLDTLGIGGRRVLVSRQWSGKTLADHRWDQVAWVRRVLGVSLGHEEADLDDPDGLGGDVVAAREGRGPAPIAWQLAHPGDVDVPDLGRRLLRAISTRIQHRAVLAAARAADPPGNVSATGGRHGAPG